MEKKQIQKLIDYCKFNSNSKNSRLIETHFSWIILTDKHAYKIKRPVKYSFVDFSTPDLRNSYCQLEVELNRRLAPDMYLSVVPVTANGITENASPKNEEIIDYAVKMKRMDNNRRMDNLMKKGEVDQEDIEKIAKMLARFHKNTGIVKNTLNTFELNEKYKDILSIGDYISKHFGEEYLERVRNAVCQSYLFLKLNRNFLNQRIIKNYQRDCHGDLNGKNIFLYDKPVIFNCIDFNKEHRVIDVLNEIAFFSVDLDFNGHALLGNHLFHKYMQSFGDDMNGQTGRLYNYYKSYCANVRARASATNSVKNSNKKERTKDVKIYLDLMLIYIGKLNLKPVNHNKKTEQEKTTGSSGGSSKYSLKLPAG